MTSTTENLESGVTVRCESCSGQSFRKSRLKLRDVWSLLALQYPARCAACNKRQMVPRILVGQLTSGRGQMRMPRTEAAESRASRTGPSAVGGTSEWQVPVHEPVAMPDLHGVKLNHLSSLPLTEEDPRR